jgi:acetoin utilization deacetylase AcuC-like enzyme
MRAFFHPDQQLHNPQQFMRTGRISNPTELPARAESLLNALQRRQIKIEKPKDYGSAPALTIHTGDYLEYLSTAYATWKTLPNAGPEVLPNCFPYWNSRIEDPHRPPCPSHNPIAKAGYYLGDLAVPIGEHTFTSILASAHAATAAADAVLAGDGGSYALCRPCGHHARADRASGFCYVNNAAVAAARLRSKFKKVVILDIDAHHGDGTQAIFYQRGDIFTISIHADPAAYYPFFTGYEHERGYGNGEGANLNIPLAPGDGDAALMKALDSAREAMARFGAEALVLALGFDNHLADPIGVLKVSTEAFAPVGTFIRGLKLPTVVVQEGGYAISVLGDCLDKFLDGARDFS